ncbi:MAG: PQQ-binding-like beta-propeller repeat protein [Verrucomicrobiales bacterium]|nr:PQQ-binding-like beta-propeller repeat protein [Verrucomicrobiales bacterium]
MAHSASRQRVVFTGRWKRFNLAYYSNRSDADRRERNKILTDLGEDPKTFKVRQIAKNIRLLALELDEKTGKLKREIELTVVESPEAIHALNSYASPTPFLEGDRLYAHFGNFGTFCLDTKSGDIIWQTRLPLEHGVGPGSSPLLYDKYLILICDGIDRQYVTALDKNTGEKIWEVDRPEMRATNGDNRKAYCTPIVVTPKGGEPQVICMGAQWLMSYDPATGEENWRLDHGSGFSVVPRPVFSEKEQLLYISTGFGKPQLWAIRPDGSGDITGSDKVVWKEPKRIPARPSPLLVGDELYTVTDGGVASCFDAATGENHWTERIGGNYSASPLFADGKIYLCNHEGKAMIIKPGKTYEVVAENELGEQLMASPVALDGKLIVRSAAALYCFSE